MSHSRFGISSASRERVLVLLLILAMTFSWEVSAQRPSSSPGSDSISVGGVLSALGRDVATTAIDGTHLIASAVTSLISHAASQARESQIHRVLGIAAGSTGALAGSRSHTSSATATKTSPNTAVGPTRPKPPARSAPHSPVTSMTSSAAGCSTTQLGANDDGSTGSVSLPFTMNFFGTNYSSLYVNNNGNVTFGSPLGTYTPFALMASSPAIIAPFFADIDTRSAGSDAVSYGAITSNGHTAFCVNWLNVGYFSGHVDKLISAQLIIENRDDRAPGDFDIIFNYDHVGWETGDASGGSNGFGGTAAEVGFSAGDGNASHFFKLPGSITPGAFLDSNGSTGLMHNDFGSSVLGQYIFTITAGVLQLPPTGGPLTQAEAQIYNEAERCACGAGGTHTSKPVSTPWGNFTHSFSDLTIPGRGPALAFARTYNSYPNMTVPAGPLGFGWSNPYDMSLSLSTTCASGVAQCATITQENGAQVVFNETGTGTNFWVPAMPRVIATLTYNSGPNTYTFTRQATQLLTFDGGTGHLDSSADLNGNTLSLSYNGAGQLITATDGASRTLSFAYYTSGPGSGDIHTVTDPTSRAVSFTYDAAGNLQTATEPNGGTWTFSYDANHRMLTMLDPNQSASLSPVPVVNHYDTQGRVDWQTDELVRKTSFDYSGLVADPPGLVGTVTITDPKLNEVQERYLYGEKVGVTAGFGTPNAATTTYVYDPDTLLPTRVINPKTHSTVFTYDSLGNQTSAKDPLGNLTTATYNSLNEPLTVTDAIGNSAGTTSANYTTTYTYDGTGNLTQIATPCVLDDGTTSCGTRTTIYHHADPLHTGDVTSTVDPNGKTRLFTYDSAGDLTSATDPLLNETLKCYDSIGRETAEVAPIGTAAAVNCASTQPAPHTTYFTYDASNQLLTSTDALGHATIRTYDANENLATYANPKPSPNVTQYGYDVANELTSITRPDTTVLHNAYFPDGSLELKTDAAGHATAYTYDSLGRLSTSTDPDGHITTDTYDPDGNLATVVDAGLRTTTYSYDDGDRFTSITHSDGTTPDVWYTYDPDSQRLTMADGTGTTYYTFDSLHRLLSQKDGSSQMMSYGYDLADHLTSMTYPGSHTVTRTYDDAGRLSTIADWLSHTTTYNYDADSNVTTQAYPNSTLATYTPDAADQLSNISDTKSGTPFATFAYTRNNADMVTQATPTITGQSPPAETYGYSPIEQLNAVNTVPYTFDAADNLTGTPSGTKLDYDAANQLCWTATSTAACTASAPAGATSYSNSLDGERTAMTPPTGNPTVFYGYDQENRLTAVRGAQYRTDVLSSNPVGYWRLGETAGTTAADSSGYARNGTASSVTWGAATPVSSDSNKAATFSGAAGSNIVLPSTLPNADALDFSSTNKFTLEAWVNAPATQTANAAVIARGYAFAEQYGIDVNASKYRFFVRDNTTSHTLTLITGTVGPNATWQHVVGVFDPSASRMELWVNGVMVGSATPPVSLNVANGNPSIGARKSSSTDNYSWALNGSIDEAAIYPAALTGAQIVNHSKAAGSNYSGTVTADGPDVYWRLDETGGTGAADSSMHGQTGSYLPAFPVSTTSGALTSESDRAITLNGTTQYVNDAAASSTTSSFTMEAWIKTTQSSGGRPFFVAKGWTSSNTPFEGLSLSAAFTKAEFRVKDDLGTDVSVDGSTTVNNGLWHHIVGVRDATVPTANVLSIYVDGKLDGSLVMSTLLSTVSTNTTTAGALRRPAVANYANATIDEAAYYARILDAATVQRHYFNGTHLLTVAASYAYNGDGTRTDKYAAGTNTHFTWETADGLPLLASDGTVQYVYGLGGVPLEQVTGSTATYFHQDQQGSTRALTDQGGNTVATYSTDAYGNPSISTGLTQTPLRYNGEYRDNETGFIYLRARYYDPATAQFLSVDPALALTGSAYGYAANDPLDEGDATGLYPGEGLVDTMKGLAQCAGADLYAAVGGSGCSDGPSGPTASNGKVVHGVEKAASSAHVQGYACAIICVRLLVGFSGFSHFGVGFGPASGFGLSFPSSVPSSCQSDQFFAQYGLSGVSLERPKYPGRPYSDEYGRWNFNASTGPGVEVGGGFVHWWNVGERCC
jgi:RHS repeat-associated protein